MKNICPCKYLNCKHLQIINGENLIQYNCTYLNLIVFTNNTSLIQVYLNENLKISDGDNDYTRYNIYNCPNYETKLSILIKLLCI